MPRDSGYGIDLKGTSSDWRKSLSGHDSPDLNSKTIYRDKFRTVQDMKNDIILYSREIYLHLCQRINNKFQRKMKICIQWHGRPLKQVIWNIFMSIYFWCFFFFIIFISCVILLLFNDHAKCGNFLRNISC